VMMVAGRRQVAGLVGTEDLFVVIGDWAAHEEDLDTQVGNHQLLVVISTAVDLGQV